MASNKRSARAKQRAAFEAGLEDGLSAGGMDDSLLANMHAKNESTLNMTQPSATRLASRRTATQAAPRQKRP